MKDHIYTVGHSTQPLEKFVSLLKRHGITALCDIRSLPYSRINPQFNREVLKKNLKDNGIAYIFLGEELGVRPADRTCYLRGKVQYNRLARTDLFRRGLERLEEGMKSYRIVLMCAEKDPLECHRIILIARYLQEQGIQVEHIREEGRVESHEEAINRLIGKLGLLEDDLFRARNDLIKEAYAIQAEKIAYRERQLTGIRKGCRKQGQG